MQRWHYIIPVTCLFGAIAVALAVAGTAVAGDADAPSLQEQLEALAAKTSTVQTLQARFVQERHTPLLKKPLVSRGTILVKGDRTLWNTQQPRKSVTLIDATSLRVYYPEQKLLEVYDLDRRLGELAASPLPRMNVLSERFEIEHDADAEADPSVLAIRLTPKDPSLRQYVPSIRVRIDTETGLASRVQWEDEDGEQTVLRFDRMKPNAKIDDDEMKLNVPSDVKVVHPLGDESSEGAEAP